MCINFKKHVVDNHTKDNIVQFILYSLAFVFVHVFKFFKITPNQISFTSFILCLVSCYFLFNNQIAFFILLWYISHFLDYCDGTLARLIGKTTNMLLRLDHFLDLIRIIFTFLFIAMYYESNHIWILTFIFISSFLISQILVLEYDFKKNIVLKRKNKPLLKKNNVIIKHIYNIVFTLNGHTLFLVGLMLININYAISILFYLILLNIKNIFGPLNYLINNKRNK